jgi:hypothetical protein
MKKLNILGIVALVACAVGCVTARHTETLLWESGFASQPAITPEQQAHLKTIPAHKVTMVMRDGQPYYVYPDLERQALYVGEPAQYQAYLKLRAEEKIRDEQSTTAELNSTPGWSVWGGWGGVYMGAPAQRY